MADAEEQADGEPVKKTKSRKSKKSKKHLSTSEEPKEEPAESPIYHEPVVMAESAMPPPQPTPSVGQLKQKPRVRDFWVCWGLLFIFALVCGIGFAVLHTTTFAKGKDKHRLMEAVREMGTHGAVRISESKGADSTGAPAPAGETAAPTTTEEAAAPP